MTADPESGGDGTAAGNGGIPISIAQQHADPNEIINNDGSGRLYDEMLDDLNNTDGIYDIAFIGYSHGGGMIKNLADRLYADPTWQNPLGLQSIVYFGTIDAVMYGTGKDYYSTVNLSASDGQYVHAPVSVIPAIAASGSASNYYETNGYYWYGIPTNSAFAVHGGPINSANNTYYASLDHSSNGVDVGVLSNVERDCTSTLDSQII